MKAKLILLSVLALAILAACDRPANAARMVGQEANKAAKKPVSSQDPPKTQAPTQSATDAKSRAPATADAEALMMLAAVNDHEIAAAEQAFSKNVDGGTLKFANLMRDEHSKNQVDTRRLMDASSSIESDAVKEQKRKGAAELARLAALNGDAYEKGYIDAMVKGHSEALAMLDSKLSTASSDAVRKHLAMTRAHVAKHLELARALQGDKSR